MEQDDLKVGTLINRRKAILFAGMSGAFGINKTQAKTASPSRQIIDYSQIDAVATPALTEGPFFVDEKLNRSNLLSDTTRASVVEGLPFQLQVTVCENVGDDTYYPLPDAYVDLWHADAAGTYSDVNNTGIQSENTLGQTWLRGFQVTDENGIVTFNTIYPGWYISRTIHFHFKVRRYDANNQQTYEFTSQLFIDDDINDEVLSVDPYNTRGDRSVRNTNDSIYNENASGGVTAGSILTLNVTDTPDIAGKTATFVVGFDLEPNTSVKNWSLF